MYQETRSTAEHRKAATFAAALAVVVPMACDSTMHWIAGALLLSSVLAQEPDVALLQSSDWRERNRTTLALSRQTKPDVAALVRLLAAPPQGETAAAGLWGGRALVFQHPDPHQQVLAAAEFESVRQDATHAAYGLVLKAASDLVIPFDSQDLAGWLLLQHAPKHPEVAELFTAFVPTTFAQARAWLHCGRPDEERIMALLGESASADAVAYALHDAGASYRAVLHKALLTGSPAARRAVFKLTDLELLDAEGVMPVAVAQFLTDSSESARQHAGHLLLQRPEAAARELASQFGDRRALQRRALAMACLLGEAAAPLTAAALSVVTHRDAVVRQRALTTLARAALRQDVVGSALLEGLRHAPRVPASLRPEIEAVFDRWFLATETRFAYAPEVMLLWRLGPP